MKSGAPTALQRPGSVESATAKTRAAITLGAATTTLDRLLVACA